MNRVDVVALIGDVSEHGIYAQVVRRVTTNLADVKRHRSKPIGGE